MDKREGNEKLSGVKFPQPEAPIRLVLVVYRQQSPTPNSKA